jgi:uncharacterized protein YndB with AHSA1/START domain
MPTTTTEDFVITRTLNAPRNLVWKAWTEPERLAQWWGPKGFKVTHSKMDLRPDGTFHYCLEAPNGSPMWGRWVFREIVPQEKLVLISSFSDEKGGVSRHPLHMEWPLEMFSTFSFEDAGDGKTRLTIRWAPHNATEPEIETFEKGRTSMTQGWSGTFEQLESYLSTATE